MSDTAREQSFQTALGAAERSPENDPAWDYLEELADELQRPDEVSDLYRAVIERGLPQSIQNRFAERAVKFHKEWYLDSPERMIGLLTTIIKKDPSAEWAFEQLTMMLTAAEQWDRLLSLYDQVLLTTTDRAKRKRLLDDAAHVAKDFAADLSRAADYIQQLLLLDPTNAKLVTQLERLLEREERWADLIELWRGLIPMLPAAEGRALRLKIAVCCLERMQQPEQALVELAAVVSETPGEEEACRHLETILSLEEAPQDARRRALGLLRKSYDIVDRSSDVVRILELSLTFLDEDEKTRIHREIGSRLAILGRDTEAIGHYEALLISDPSDADARKQLRQLARRSERHDLLVAALVAAAAVPAVESAQQVALLSEAAGLQRDVLENQTAAIDLYTQVLAIEDADPQSALSAAHCLNELLAAAERAEERLPVLEQLASLERSPVIRRFVLGQAARLADELADPDRALATWKVVADAGEFDREAMAAIIDLLERNERWEELREALQRRADAGVLPLQRRSDLIRLADVCATKLGRPHDAIDAWLTLREEFGEDGQIIDALTELMSQTERWEELATLLGGAAQRERGEASFALLRLADVQRQQLRRPADAAELYAQTLGVDPANAAAREGLRALTEHEECAAQAVKTLAWAYGITDDWEQTLELLDARLATAAEAAEQVAILVEAARLYEQRGEDPASALSMVARALVLEPANLTLEAQLMRLTEQTGQWADAARCLCEAAGGADSSARAAELRVREGQLYESQLGDHESALGAYQAAAELSPGKPEIAEAVARCGAQAGSWEIACGATVEVIQAKSHVDAELLAALEQAAEAGAGFQALADGLAAAVSASSSLTPSLAAALQSRIAGWYRHQVGDTEAGNKALSLALELAPDDDEVLARLATFQREAPGADLVATLLRMDDKAPDSLDTLLEAAGVTLEHTEDVELRRSVLNRLLRKATELWKSGRDATGEQQPSAVAPWALDQLVALHTAEGAEDLAIDLLLEGSQLPIEPADSLELKRRAAARLTERGDRVRAIDVYRSVRAAAADDLDTIRRLASLLEQEERISGSVPLRLREIELTEEPAERLALRLEASRKAARIEELSGRVELLLQNLGEHPGHPASIDALCEVLSERGQFGALVSHLEQQATQLQDAGESGPAAALWSRAAQLAEQQLKDTDRAIAAYTNAVELEASNESLDALAQLHLAAEQPAKAAKRLAQRLQTTEPDKKVAIILKLARARIQAGQTDEAIPPLQEAFAEAPRNAEVRKLLIRLLRDQDKHEQLAATLTTAAENAADEEMVLSYCREAAEIYYDRLSSPERAISVLQRAVTIAPEDRKLKSMLAEGLCAAGQLEEARTLLTELIEAFGRRGSVERAAAHFQLGRVLHAEGSIAEAIEQLDVASKMDDGNITILRELAVLSREAGELDRAERAYRTLHLRLRHLGDAETPIGTAEVLLELSRLATDRDQPEQADELVESALDALSQNDAEAPRLQARLREHGAFELLRRVLDYRLGYVHGAVARAEIFSEKGEVLERLGRFDEAVEARLKAVESDAASPEVHAAAIDLAQRRQALPRYVSLIEGLLESARRDTDVLVRCELLLRLGEALENQDELDRAAKQYAEAESTGVRQVDVIRAQARLAGRRGDQQTQIELLEKLTAIGGDAADTRTDAMYRMAEVQLASPEKLSDGLATLAEALAEDTRTERAALILKRALDENPQHLALLDLYEQVARKSEDDETLMHYLSCRAAHPEATPAQAQEAVVKAQQLERHDQAEQLLLRAVEIGRANDNLWEVAWALIALAERSKDAGDIAGAVSWLEEASLYADPEPVFTLGRQVAELAFGAGGDLTLAARLYEKLLEREPTARDAWQPLAEIYQKLGDLDRLERVVSETVDGLDDPAARNELRLVLAHGLLGTSDRIEEAVAVLREVLADDPLHQVAQTLLADYYQKTGNMAELQGLLRQQHEAALGGDDQAAVKGSALRLAHAVIEEDPEEAANVYRSALERVPDDPQLLRGLLACLGPDHNVFERAELTERLLAAGQWEAPGATALELVELYQAVENDEGVLRALKLGYQLAPENEEIRARLEQRYRDEGDFAGLSQMLLEAADKREDLPGKTTLWREAAAVYRDRLGDPAQAAALLRQACEALPDDAELALELTKTLAVAGEHEAALETITTALERDLEPSERLGLLQTRAGMRHAAGDEEGSLEDLEAAFAIDSAAAAPMLETMLETRRQSTIASGDQQAERAVTMRLMDVLKVQGKHDDSLAMLMAWVERAPEDVECLRGLRQVQMDAQRWDGVIDTCRRLLAVEEDAELAEAAETLLLAYQTLGQIEQARESLEAARLREPDNARVRAALRTVYEQTGAHRELALLFIDEAQAVDDDEQKAAYLRWAGQTLVSQGDVESAMPALEQVLELSPGDAGATISIADISMMQGDFDQAHNVLDEAINRCKGRKFQNELCMFWQRKSYVSRAQGDVDNQVAHLLKAHQTANKNADVAAELADLSESLERWDVATKALRAITNFTDVECRISPAQAMVRQGRIAQLQGDDKLARMWARRLKRAADEGDPDVIAFLQEMGEL